MKRATTDISQSLREHWDVFTFLVVELTEMAEDGASRRRFLHGFFDFPREDGAGVEEDPTAFDESISHLSKQVSKFDGLRTDNANVSVSDKKKR